MFMGFFQSFGLWPKAAESQIYKYLPFSRSMIKHIHFLGQIKAKAFQTLAPDRENPVQP
jgi:hypothetical protein